MRKIVEYNCNESSINIETIENLMELSFEDAKELSFEGELELHDGSVTITMFDVFKKIKNLLNKDLRKLFKKLSALEIINQLSYNNYQDLEVFEVVYPDIKISEIDCSFSIIDICHILQIDLDTLELYIDIEYLKNHESTNIFDHTLSYKDIFYLLLHMEIEKIEDKLMQISFKKFVKVFK